MDKIPVALYLRRSSNRQKQSIEDQEKAGREYAAEHNMVIVRVYVDDAKSGSTAEGRAEFLRMIADACSPGCPFKFILVYNVKRFSRGDNDETGYYRHLLHKNDVEVIYVSENFSGDDSDDLVRPMKQWQAHKDLKDLSKDTIGGLLLKADKGFWLGGVPPFGYDLKYETGSGAPLMTVRFLSDGSKEVRDEQTKSVRILPPKGRLVVSKDDGARLALSTPERVALVKRIFHMYVREGKGLGAIAETLNREGVPSPGNCNFSEQSGRFWSKGTLRFILKNRQYTGDLVWNRRTTARFNRIEGGRAQERPRIELKKPRVNGESDWLVIPNAHPAIVDRETFEEAQRLMKERGKKCRVGAAFRSGRAKHSRYLLSGIMKCARCGHPYHGYPANSTKHRKNGEKIVTYYYACSAFRNKGKSVCEGFLLRWKETEDYVLERIGLRVERLLSQGGRKALREIIARELGREAVAPRREKEEIRGRLSKIDDDIERLLASLTPAIKEIVEPKLVKLATEKKELERKLREKEAMPEESKMDPNELAGQIVEGISGFRELFEQGTLEEKKEFVRAFVEKLVVDADKGTGTLYIREFPPLEAIRPRGNGNSYFEGVAGARYEPATMER
ncbi:MAG: recombinase family protein [Candidatus Eisenbacteria bacterium]